MQHHSLAAGVVALATACATPNQPTADRNATVVRRLYEDASNRDDPALLATLVAADFVSADGRRGPAGFAHAIALLRAGMPDVRFTIEDVLAAGDRVAVRWRFTGTHTGTFRGIAPTGVAVRNEGIAIYQLRAAQVIAVWLQNDRLGLLQQLGAVPAGIGAVPAGIGAQAPQP